MITDERSGSYIPFALHIFSCYRGTIVQYGTVIKWWFFLSVKNQQSRITEHPKKDNIRLAIRVLCCLSFCYSKKQFPGNACTTLFGSTSPSPTIVMDAVFADQMYSTLSSCRVLVLNDLHPNRQDTVIRSLFNTTASLLLTRSGESILEWWHTVHYPRPESLPSKSSHIGKTKESDMKITNLSGSSIRIEKTHCWGSFQFSAKFLR